MRRHTELPLLTAALIALSGCDGCRGSKPYTPYTLSDPPAASSAPDARASAPGEAGRPVTSDGGGAFVAVAGTAAPGDGKSWPLGDGAAAPPAGHSFSEGLVFDADGDGKTDLVAWSRAPDGLRGEVWFASGKDPGRGRTVAALPGDLAAPGCNPSTSLTRLGVGMVVFDFDPRCGPRTRDRAGRWLAVFRIQPGAPPELGLEMRLGAPADGESFAVAVDGRDRDGDGRGDLTVSISVGGAPRPLGMSGTAAATLAYFDRPAGLSRDPSEPETSLKALSAGLVADGRKKTTAPRIAAAAMAARRLHALLCEEGGKPVISTSAGPIRCGDVRLVEDASMAEAEAALNLGDPLGAMAAAGRLEGRRKDLDALLAKHIPSVPGKLVRTTAATPDVQPPPSFGPVAFNSGGDILVHTRDRVIRVDRTSFEESVVDLGAGAPPSPAAPAVEGAPSARPAATGLRWPARLSWPAGDTPAWTLIAVEERCDAATLVARFAIGAEHADVPLPILTPGRCVASPRVAADLLGASSQGALLAVRGEVVALLPEASPHPVLAESLSSPAGGAVDLGAARSPDGGVIALFTPRGVLVATPKRQGRAASAKLWTLPLIDGATACAPSDGGERLACAVKNAVAIYDAR